MHRRAYARVAQWAEAVGAVRALARVLAAGRPEKLAAYPPAVRLSERSVHRAA